MIAVYCQDDLHGNAVAQVLGDFPVRMTQCRIEFAEALPRTCCAVLVLPSLSDPQLLSWIDSTFRGFPHVGWVLLTGYAPQNVRAVINVRTGIRLVWLAALDHALVPVVLKVLQSDGPACLATLIREVDELPPELREALVRACLLARPPHSVFGLGKAVDLSERRLRYLWTRSMAPASSPRDFVDWLLLGWAFRLRGGRRSWAQVAVDLSTKEDTLRAVCHRRTGFTLGQLAREGPGVFRQAVAEWWASAHAS